MPLANRDGDWYRTGMIMQNRPRLAVLGLDGLPFSLARDLCAQGVLPNLARLIEAPGCRPITAELPELSPVNWTSFFTACGPEEHGVFGFTRLDPATYTLSVTDATHVVGPTIFDRLGRAGLVSRVINLPNTYPAQPLKGMLIAGFPVMDPAKAVFPPPLAGMLRGSGYMLEADTVRGGADPDFLLSQLHAALRGREAALGMFWPDLAWDLFVFVLTETDRLGHFLFPGLRDPDHAHHAQCLAFMREWDRVVGVFLDRFEALPGPKRLLITADHGFTALKQEVDLNVWLRSQGVLADGGPAASEFDSTRITGSTRAFALDPGRIYIHSRDRFARGTVDSVEAGQLRRSIVDGLLGLRFEGEPVIRECRFREELYPGPLCEQAPDIVCVPHDGFELKGKFDRSQLFGLYGRQGMHTVDDVFFYDSQESDCERLRDVGKEVLRYFGVGRIVQ